MEKNQEDNRLKTQLFYNDKINYDIDRDYKLILVYKNQVIPFKNIPY
jgi:hypothetical protein